MKQPVGKYKLELRQNNAYAVLGYLLAGVVLPIVICCCLPNKQAAPSVAFLVVVCAVGLAFRALHVQSDD